MTLPSRRPGDPEPLTSKEINELDLVEIIMRAPLDQAVTIAVGRASTCWTDLDGSFGMAGVFDDATAVQIVDALLARISAELAGAVAEVKGQDRAAAMIPTIAFPTESVERQQCPEVVRIEGHSAHSQCLLLEGHAGDEHQNGNLRWRKDESGEITAWFDSAVYDTLTLGELIRTQGIMLQPPHLPADVAAPLQGEPDETSRITGKSTPAVEPYVKRPLTPSDPEE